MDSPSERERHPLGDNERHSDEVAYEQNNWLGVPANYSPYHPGYTTNHWLMVFRAVEATA